ncbi:hypothetical protein [Jatrophihabitans sp. GAS493]|uniref:hypothetical protein n=1 Tax=Jatrophihabitans sp. GAS493 TaxID=1907575 RepID=UPI000BB8A72C|nr:hypothetical protein [Jatrophihabitans sp. GAS493]
MRRRTSRRYLACLLLLLLTPFYSFLDSTHAAWTASDANPGNTFTTANWPAKLAFSTPPADATMGTTFTTSPVVSVQDAAGNPIATPNVPVTLTLNAAPTPGGTLTCTTNPLTSSAASATFTGCSINIAGTFTITASSPGLTSVTSAVFTVYVAPTKLVFTTAPGTPYAYMYFPTVPVVSLEDASSNVVGGAPRNVTVSVSAGSIACTATTVASSAGTASFPNCAISPTDTTTKSYTVTASSPGLTSATTSVTVTGVRVGFQTYTYTCGGVLAPTVAAPGPSYLLQVNNCGFTPGSTLTTKVVLLKGGGDTTSTLITNNSGAAITVSGIVATSPASHSGTPPPSPNTLTIPVGQSASTGTETSSADVTNCSSTDCIWQWSIPTMPNIQFGGSRLIQ